MFDGSRGGAERANERWFIARRSGDEGDKAFVSLERDERRVLVSRSPAGAAKKMAASEVGRI